MGVSKLTTYDWLARELGVPKQKAHFANVYTVPELEIMVAALQRLHDKTSKRRRRRPWKKPEPWVKKPKSPVLPQLPRHETLVRKSKKRQAAIEWKKKYGTKKQNILPRDQMLKALEELKDARTLKSTQREGAARGMIRKSPLMQALELIGMVH